MRPENLMLQVNYTGGTADDRTKTPVTESHNTQPVVSQINKQQAEVSEGMLHCSPSMSTGTVR
jgi:hypothetical protein